MECSMLVFIFRSFFLIHDVSVNIIICLYNPKLHCFIKVCQAYLNRSTETRCLSENWPAATADHMTKNIPTAILFKEEGSRPRCFRMGSTTLSFRGISRRMSTASNMVSQAAGKRNVIWGVWTKEQIRWDRSKKAPKQNKNNNKNKLPNYIVTKLSVCMRLWCLDIALAPPGGHVQNKRKPTIW